MRKKRQGRVSQERWLVSYADFITLLFAFFVVLFATGQSDKHKKVELAASIQTAFHQMGLFEARSPLATLAEAPGLGGSAQTPALALPATTAPKSMLDVRQHIEEA